MICFPLDNTEYEAKDMGAYLGTRTRGVFSAEGNLAVSAGAGGLTVTVAPGLAWLKRDEYWGTAALNEAVFSLTLDAADGVLKRMDAIVCRLDKVGNKAELVVKKGSFAEAPTVAAPVRDESYDELYLATVLVDGPERGKRHGPAAERGILRADAGRCDGHSDKSDAGTSYRPV